MSIINTIIIAFILLAFSFDSVSGEKNTTDAKLKAYLMSKSNDFETLIALLNKTGYSNVFWHKHGVLKARPGNEKNAVWDNSPKLDEFVNKAIEFGFSGLLLGSDNAGNWSIATTTEVIFLDGDPSKGTVKTKTVEKSFWYGKQPKSSLCDPQTIKKSFTGSCYIPISTKWFISKYWFTYDPTIE